MSNTILPVYYNVAKKVNMRARKCGAANLPVGDKYHFSIEEAEAIAKEIVEDFYFLVTVKYDNDVNLVRRYSYPSSQFIKAFIRFRMECSRCISRHYVGRVVMSIQCESDALNSRDIFVKSFN